MLHALILGFRQLADPAVQRLLLRCVLLTLATFLALVAAVAALLFGFDLTGISWLDQCWRPPARPSCWSWRGCCSRSWPG
jgi:hypothetical protein